MGCPWVINACSQEATKSQGRGWGSSLHKCCEGMGPGMQAQSFLGVWGWGSWYSGDSLLTHWDDPGGGVSEGSDTVGSRDRLTKTGVHSSCCRGHAQLRPRAGTLLSGHRRCPLCKFLLRLLRLLHWQAGPWWRSHLGSPDHVTLPPKTLHVSHSSESQPKFLQYLTTPRTTWAPYSSPGPPAPPPCSAAGIPADWLLLGHQTCSYLRPLY